MKALEFVAEVDMQHRLQLELPGAAPGPVRVLVLVPEQEAPDAEDEADAVWMQAVAHQWREELADPREDIYTLEDGEPLHAKRPALCSVTSASSARRYSRK